MEQSDEAERDKHVPDTVGNGGMRLRWIDTTEQGEREVDQEQASEIYPEKKDREQMKEGHREGDPASERR